MAKEKMVTIYDKNGNTREIRVSLKACYIGKGWSLKQTTKNTGDSNE